MTDKKAENKKEKGRIRLTGRAFFEIVFIITIIAFIRGEYFIDDTSGIRLDKDCKLLSEDWYLLGNDCFFYCYPFGLSYHQIQI